MSSQKRVQAAAAQFAPAVMALVHEATVKAQQEVSLTALTLALTHNSEHDAMLTLGPALDVFEATLRGTHEPIALGTGGVTKHLWSHVIHGNGLAMALGGALKAGAESEEVCAYKPTWDDMEVAVGLYQRDIASVLNRALRNDIDIYSDDFHPQHKDVEDIRRTNKNLRFAINNTKPFPKETTMYRVISGLHAADLVDGSIIQDKGFVSMSDRKNIDKILGEGKYIENPVTMEIHVPAGVRAAEVNQYLEAWENEYPGEREYIFMPNHFFKVDWHGQTPTLTMLTE